MTRKNPKRIPATKADLQRMESQTFERAVRFATAIFLTVLYDKEHATSDDIQRVGKEINELTESVNQGYVTIPDLVNVLKKEYGLEL